MSIIDLLRKFDLWHDLWADDFAKAVDSAKGDEDFLKVNVLLGVGSSESFNLIYLLNRYLNHGIATYVIDPEFEPDYSAFRKVGIPVPSFLKCKLEDANLSVIREGRRLVELSNVLQTLNSNYDCILMLNTIARIIGSDGYVIVVDEVERAGWRGKYDWLLHYAFNWASWLRVSNQSVVYNRQKSDLEYRELFTISGLEVLQAIPYARNLWLFVLKKRA